MKKFIFFTALILSLLGLNNSTYAQVGAGLGRAREMAKIEKDHKKSLASSAQQFSNFNIPHIFEHVWLDGVGSSITNSISNLHDKGWGDIISSCSVPIGWTIIFYEHTEYRGKSFKVTGPATINILGHFKWNDKISSISVSRSYW